MFLKTVLEIMKNSRLTGFKLGHSGIATFRTCRQRVEGL